MRIFLFLLFFLIKICASEERFFHVSTLGSFISISVKRGLLKRSFFLIVSPGGGCTSEEGFLTFQHLEVLFQSWWNVYLQRVVPSRKAFSRFDTWKFYFNLGETWASRKVFILFCISTLVKWNSEERLLHFNSWRNVPPKRAFILFAFQL